MIANSLSLPAPEKARDALWRILLWAGVVLAIVLSAGIGMVLFSAQAIDQVQAQGEHELVKRTLERRLERLTDDITSAAIRNDAVKATQGRLDMTWIDENFGVYYSQYQHHDRTILIDADGRLVYASEGGEMTAPSASAAFAEAVGPVVARVRALEAVSPQTPRATRVGFSAVSTASGAVRLGSDIYMVVASTIVPEKLMPGWPNRPAVVVSAQRVGPSFLKHLRDDIGVTRAAVIPLDGRSRGADIALVSVDDRPLARLTWKPKLLGTGVLRDAAPIFIGALALFLLSAAGLGWRIVRALNALARHEATLSDTLDDLTQARDRAEAASVAKSQFLANISHEIRTPMNGVLGMAQVMAMGELSERQRDNLRIIRDSGESLLALLNDVLDLAKIEAGKLEIALDEVDVAALAAGACATFEGVAAAKGLTIRHQVDAQALGLWRTDGGRLRQILSNLVSNAVKFTPQGEVAVHVAPTADGLRIAVRDTGVGIPPERLGELFGKFNQIDASSTRQVGGSGLGLAISRELAVLLGGDITLESRLGEGSCFTVVLPAQPVQSRAAA
jgi:signal transduction histidine kinase